jgi:4-amino-4-deoxy-L-arabinose transferase-like glycosyltransferase
MLLVLLILVALALRVWYLWINPLSPQFSNADDGDYYRRALRLAVTGQYLDDAWLIRPPFHVFVFAGLIRLAIDLGGSPAMGVRLIQGFQAALGVLMVPLCYALARRLFDARAGLIFAAFWAIWFPFVELPATLFSEPIYLFLFTLHLHLLLRYDDENRWRDLAASGFVLGLAALTRSPALYALVFAIPWLVWRAWRRVSPSLSSPIVLRPAPRSGIVNSKFITRNSKLITPARALRASIAPFALLVATTLIVVLPWTARNWIVYHKIIPVDTLGPINLWLDLGEPGERDAKIRALQAVPQAERQALASREARAILAQDPLRPLRPMWSTFRHIWKAQYVEDYFVKRSFFTRPLREAAPLGLPGDILWLVFSFAGVAGILHPATDRPFKVVLGLWLLYSILTVLVFHVEPRYLLPIWFLLGLYGSATLSRPRRFWTGLRRRRVRGLAIGGLLLALAVVFVSYRDYPSILARGFNREWQMWRGDRAYQRGDYAAAEGAFRGALQADPGFADAQISLALALAAEGRPAEGLAVVDPAGSRRSALVAGALHRATGDIEGARGLLGPSEGRSGEDTQQWSQRMLRPEPRSALVLGDEALDLGYISGFGGSELAGDRSMRWLLGSGSIVLPLPAPLAAGSSVVLDVAAPLPLDGPLQIVVDGRWRTTVPTTSNWRRYRFALPAGLSGARQLRIDLQAPSRLPIRDNPKSDDARPLSVMVHRVAVE